MFLHFHLCRRGQRRSDDRVQGRDDRFKWTDEGDLVLLGQDVQDEQDVSVKEMVGKVRLLSCKSCPSCPNLLLRQFFRQDEQDGRHEGNGGKSPPFIP